MSDPGGERAMIRAAFWIGLALGITLAAPAALALDAQVLGEGAGRLRARDDAGAAARWLGSASATVAEARDPAARRDGCLLYVLATLAFERGGDAEAYGSWGRAVQCYASTGTSWEAERSQLAARVRRADEGLRALAGREAAVGPVREDASVDAELVALSRLVPLLTYDGPTLSAAPPTEAGESSSPAQVAPLVAPRLPGGGAPAPAPPAGPTVVPRRGVVPRTSP